MKQPYKWADIYSLPPADLIDMVPQWRAAQQRRSEENTERCSKLYSQMSTAHAKMPQTEPRAILGDAVESCAEMKMFFAIRFLWQPCTAMGCFEGLQVQTKKLTLLWRARVYTTRWESRHLLDFLISFRRWLTWTCLGTERLYELRQQQSWGTSQNYISYFIYFSVASDERSFTKPKLVRNYVRSSMTRELLSDLSIKREFLKDIDRHSTSYYTYIGLMTYSSLIYYNMDSFNIVES